MTSSQAQMAFAKVDHISGHKIHLNEFKRMGVMQNMFSYHNGIKLEIKNRKIAGKS